MPCPLFRGKIIDQEKPWMASIGCDTPHCDPRYYEGRHGQWSIRMTDEIIADLCQGDHARCFYYTGLGQLKLDLLGGDTHAAKTPKKPQGPDEH